MLCILNHMTLLLYIFNLLIFFADPVLVKHKHIGAVAGN